MKKLKLSELNLGSAEVLTREQLKNIKGGELQYAYCTDGENAECYENRDDAVNACDADPTCDFIYVQDF